MNNIVYIILILIFGYILFKYLNSNINENFPYSPYWPYFSHWPWPWNQPTRFPRLYYDIRGDPNIVYRRHVFGGLYPYGYVFGPYVYDAQGNIIYDTTKPYYIA
jgi:hypothetical protein